MALTDEQIKAIESTIKETLMNKLRAYKPETSSMPFHYKLLGEDRMALFSFIQSLNTAFGTSIFEPIAEIIAKSRFKEVKRQYDLGNFIYWEAQEVIQEIINDLTTGKCSPDKAYEIERIRDACKKKGKINELRTVKVDLFVKDYDNTIHLFDLKTAKPNISDFKNFKRTLLEWVAIYLFRDPNANVNSYVAIPYNPYEPEQYQRWTLKGMLDLDKELKVAEEFWDFLGGEGTYRELLNCFEKVGKELGPEIDKHFSKFRK